MCIQLTGIVSSVSQTGYNGGLLNIMTVLYPDNRYAKEISWNYFPYLPAGREFGEQTQNKRLMDQVKLLQSMQGCDFTAH